MSAGAAAFCASSGGTVARRQAKSRRMGMGIQSRRRAKVLQGIARGIFLARRRDLAGKLLHEIHPLVTARITCPSQCGANTRCSMRKTSRRDHSDEPGSPGAKASRREASQGRWEFTASGAAFLDGRDGCRAPHGLSHRRRRDADFAAVERRSFLDSPDNKLSGPP